MTEQGKGSNQPRHATTPLHYRLADWLLDGVLARIRVVLSPFRLLTRLGRAVKAVVWLLSIEYAKRTFGHCGDGVRIHCRFHVTAPRNLHIGDSVHIGDKIHVSRNLVVYTMNHDWERECLPYDASRLLKPVHIGVVAPILVQRRAGTRGRH